MLFILYCALFCGLITRIRFFTLSGLPGRTLVTLFMIKVVALIAGAYVNRYELAFSDTVLFHEMGIREYHLLFSDPVEYFTGIFHHYSADQYGRLFEDEGSFWNNIRNYLIAKILAVFNIFSLKDFLINHLFFNFLCFFGNIALYRVLKKIFPALQLPLIICSFLIPSCLFFSSMIHRDGIVLAALSLFIFRFYRMQEEKAYTLGGIVYLFLWLLLIFLMRNFVVVAMLPAMAAWIIAGRTGRVKTSFFVVYLVAGILFFASGYLSPKANLPHYVSLKQQSFFDLKIQETTSVYDLKPLEPSFAGFVKNAPAAFDHALLRPYLSGNKKIQYLPFSAEVFLMEILFLLFLFFRKRGFSPHPVIYFGVFLSFSLLMLTGYIVPYAGAIVRYRSTWLPFLMIPVLCYTDWNKIKGIIHIKNIKI